MTTTALKTESETSGNVPSQASASITSVMTARTTDELEKSLALMERHATDLVASDVVRDGYLAHGHPAQLGFQHLSTMTSSRLKKQFPLFDRKEPLFRILWAQGRIIVGEELVKKYEARKQGKTYDYTKSINSRFKKMFSDIEVYREKLRELKYEETHNAT